MKYIDKTSTDSLRRAQRLEKWVEDYKESFSINPNWKIFREMEHPLNGYDKKQLYQDLWEEQGEICCYCGQRIPKPTIESGRASAEHFRHKSTHPDLALTYKNLILSCRGKEFTIIKKGETLDDVALRTGIPRGEMKNYTAPLIEKEGAIFFVSKKPKHCNEERNNKSTAIIDPTDKKYDGHENDCWRLFKYQYEADQRPAECKIDAVEATDELTKNTCGEVLGLNCDILIKERGRLYEMFENLVLYHDGEEDRPRNKEERQLHFEQQLKASYPFCSMDYSIILQNL